MSAGAYPIRFAWAVHSYADPSDVGDPVSEYATATNVWGGYDTDRTVAVSQSLESDQAGYSATVRLRNYPAVNPLDTLTDPQSLEVWTVDTVRRGVNEVLCEVSR